jgi:hypothetical protein
MKVPRNFYKKIRVYGSYYTENIKIFEKLQGYKIKKVVKYSFIPVILLSIFERLFVVFTLLYEYYDKRKKFNLFMES